MSTSGMDSEEELVTKSMLEDTSTEVDDAEFNIPKIEKPPTLESILNEPDDDYGMGEDGSIMGDPQTDYLMDDDASSIAADTASIASQDSFMHDRSRRRSPRKSLRYQRHGSVLRLVILKGMSSQILSAMDRVDAGMPTATAVSSNIAVGTSHGLVLIFDPKQVMKWCLGSVAMGTQYGAVTALSLNQDCTRLLCGFAKGQMTMWNLTDGKLLRTITDAHPPGSAILNVNFTDDSALAVCSDSAGSVYQLEMKRSIGGRSCESKCIFSGSRGEVCVIKPLHMTDVNVKVHPLKETTIIAMATLSKVIVVTLKPQQKVVGMFPLKGDPSTLPLLTWQFVIIQVSDKERIIDPVLAFARDQHIYFYQAVCNGPDDIRFSQLQQTELPYRLLSIDWLNSRTMVLIDTSERAHVFDVRGEEELEVIDLAGVELVYSTSFYKSLATGGNVSEALAYAGERACYQSLKTFTNQLVALGRKGVHVITLRNWKDRIDILMRQKRFTQALQLSASFYEGTAKAIVGLGGNSQKRKQMVSFKIVDLIDQFVDFTLATAGSPKHTRREELEEHFKGSIPVIVQHCLKMNKHDLLFGSAYERFSSSQAAKSVFLESLEPYILSNVLTSVTPIIMQDFVSHYQSKGLLQNVEACIVHMDIASLDIHQVFVLCWAHGLYDAILHVYNRGMHDYIIPLEELLVQLTIAVDSGKQLNDNQVTLGNKILVYISCCLAGRAYPYGDIEPGEAKSVKDQVFKCVTILHTKGHSDAEPTYPHLRTLLKFDTREFFNVLALAFEDDDMQGESGTEKKQRVVDILLYIMVESDSGFTPTQAGILFTFLARQMAKKDDSVMVSRALFEQVLEALCLPCENIDSRHEERQQALMELIQAGGLLHVDEVKLIQAAEKAKFFQVCERLYEERREFDKILSCYWADSLRKPMAFQYIQRILTSSKITDAEKYKVQKESLNHLEDLVEIDYSKTAQLVLIGFALTLDEAVKLLKDKEEILYKFLSGVFQINEDTGSSLYIDRQLQVEPESQEMYIELMCQHDPEAVYPYLNLVEGYRINETLQICERYQLTRATSFIMEKAGNIEGSFQVLFEKLQNDLKNVSTQSNQSTEALEEKDDQKQPIKDLVISVIQLCQRHCGSMEEKEREKFWFPLLDLFMETQKQSKDMDTDVKSMTTLVLNSMMSYISLPSILQKIMQDPVYSGGKFGEIKPLIIGMLDTYNYEKTLLHTCTNLVNHDLHRHLKSLIKAVNRGIVPKSDQCTLCSRNLVTNNENDTVICFRCGHSYHHICLKGVNSYHTLEGSPIWICHACNKTQRKERTPSTTRIQRIPSSSSSGNLSVNLKGGSTSKQQVMLDPQQQQAVDNLRRAHKTPSRLELLSELSKQDHSFKSGHKRTGSYATTSSRPSIFEHEGFQLRLTVPRFDFE